MTWDEEAAEIKRDPDKATALLRKNFGQGMFATLLFEILLGGWVLFFWAISR